MSDETDPWSHRTARLWLHAVQGQLGRLHEAEHVAARLALDRPPRHYGWKDALPMYDVDIEKHFLINAARQLSLALEALPSPPAPRHDSALLSALRNASEHALELELAVERDDVIGGCAASGIRLGKDRPV